jgi:hypothetical protein
MKKGKWSIIVDDKRIVKQYGNGATLGHVVEDNSFWTNLINSRIRAIQYSGDNLDLDQVEFNNGNKNTYFTGDIKIFADAWDKEHLKYLQEIWDSNNIQINLGKTNLDKPNEDQFREETIEEKIIRIGNRPTSYTSEDIY